MMTIATKLLLFILVSSLGLPTAFAKEAPAAASKSNSQKSARVEPPLRKGWWITVLQMDRKRRLLVIQIDKTPDVGPNLARPEDLVQAVNISDPDERRNFLNEPVRFVGSKFVLEKDLPLVSP